MAHLTRKRRISFDVPEEIFLRLNRRLPHGVKGFVFRAITVGILEELERNREEFLILLYEKKVKIPDLLTQEERSGKAKGSTKVNQRNVTRGSE